MKKSFSFIGFFWLSCTFFAYGQGMQKIDEGIGKLVDAMIIQMRKHHISRIAVGDFSANGTKTLFEEYIQEEIVNAVISRNLSDITIVERERLDEVLKEQKLSTTGLLDKKTRVALGRILGVEAIISGTTKTTLKEVKVNARMYAVATGKILAASSNVFLRNETIDELIKEPVYSRTNYTDNGIASSFPSSKRIRQKTVRKIAYALLSVTRVLHNDKNIVVTIKIENKDKRRGIAFSMYASGSDNIADFWKFFPVPKQCTLNDENGNVFPFLSTTLPYAKTNDDWLVVAPGEEEFVEFKFKNKSFMRPGKRYTLSVLIRTATADANNNIKIDKHTLYMEDFSSGS
jgi:hypothetical protein